VVSTLGSLQLREELDSGLARLTFELDHRVRYRAGQYAIVTLGPCLRRCYSMANPCDGQRVQLVAKHYKGKPGSSALFRLREGDRVPFSLPFGDMWIRSGANPVLLVAGGTGISAILAMVAELATSPAGRGVQAFYGAASRSELVLAEELEAAIERIPDARCHFVLEQAPAGWELDTGYVTDALARRASLTEDCLVYLAGPPPMVDATLAFCRERGVSLDRIYYDRFG